MSGSAVQLGDLRTRWRAWGDPDACEAVLGLHMLGLDAASFAGVADTLGRDVAVHAFDQRGHGSAAGQPTRDLAQFVDDAEAAAARIDAGRLHLVGSSMGGSVAASLAARLPGRFATLSLIATPAAGRPAFADRAVAEPDGSLENILPVTIRRWFGDDAAGPAVGQARAAIRAMSPAGHDAAWRALASFPGYADLAGRLPPTLCLAFADDVSTPPAELDEVAAAIRAAGGSATRRDLAGAGHAGLIVRPAEVAAALSDHFRFTPHEEPA